MNISFETIKKRVAAFTANAGHKISDIKNSELWNDTKVKIKDTIGKANRQWDEMFQNSKSSHLFGSATSFMFGKFGSVLGGFKIFKNKHSGTISKILKTVFKGVSSVGTAIFAAYAVKCVFTILPALITMSATIFGVSMVAEFITRMLKAALN